MRRQRRSSEFQEEPPINLTPLIDVVFVVLIMFILIAPMLELDRIELARGVKRENRELGVVEDASPVSIRVRADNSIWFRGRKVTADELMTVMRQEKKRHPKAIPQLFHDKAARFGTYQTVKNAVECAGFEQLDIILEPG